MSQRQSEPAAHPQTSSATRPQQGSGEYSLVLKPEAAPDLAAFFDQSLDLMCIAGLNDGYFKRLNPAWTYRLGWTLDELLARPFLSFVHPEDQEKTMLEVARLQTGSQTISFENRYRHRDGSYHWLQWNARPAPVQGLIYATARDISKRRQYEREIVEIVDQERRRLGRDMHDGICQALAGIAALSATLSRKLAASEDSDGSERAREINSLLKQAIRDVRDLARGLDPMDLDSETLQGALATLTVNVEHLFGLTCELRCDDCLAELDGDTEIHLFRLAQEAINNVLAHAGASSVLMELRCDDRHGVLSIRDNGAGLLSDPHASHGMGMHTMAYRARMIGASLEIKNAETGGTAVTCRFPLATNV